MSGLGGDTGTYLANTANEMEVDIKSITGPARQKLIEAAERCCAARRNLEGEGVAEANEYLKALLLALKGS